jgi:hypothetical protein
MSQGFQVPKQHFSSRRCQRMPLNIVKRPSHHSLEFNRWIVDSYHHNRPGNRNRHTWGTNQRVEFRECVFNSHIRNLKQRKFLDYRLSFLGRCWDFYNLVILDCFRSVCSCRRCERRTQQRCKSRNWNQRCLVFNLDYLLHRLFIFAEAQERGCWEGSQSGRLHAST